MSAVDVVSSTTPLRSRSPSKAPSRPSSSHLDVPPSTTQDVQMPPAPDTQDIPQSQPMTATASASSQNPFPDDSDPNAVPTYGTRSRNRPGASRPNYADDKELDMEIEAAGRLSKASSKKAASSTHQVAEPTPAAPMGFAAINSVSISNGEPSTQSSTPGPAPAPSKKRKQPGTSTISGSATPSYTVVPRSKPHHVSAYVETNLMSFSRCGAKLNNKKQLVADDGTALAANGECEF